ncbi:MAG: hypothetical protein WKG00_39835 [Polyangiaceae bacterium]
MLKLKTAAFVLTLTLASTALAQDVPAGSVERDKARTALAAGNTDEACLAFEQGHKAAVEATSAGRASVPPDEILFDLAQCHEKQGRSAVALAEYDQLAAGAGPRAADAKTRADAVRAATAAPQPAPVPQPTTGPQNPGLQPVEQPTAIQINPPPVSKAEEAAPTRIGDFMDTRLTWTIGDDDLLHETGIAQPLSPNASIGDRKQYRLFFDNLNSRFGGRENLTHLALYKKMPGFIDKLDTEASLVLRFDIGALSRNTNNLNQALYDSGSYIRAFYHTDRKADGKEGVGITFWPLDTDRFRLGYLYDISWGGTNSSINQSIFPRIQGSAPGVKVSYEHEIFNAFVGLKTASIVQVEQTLTPGTSEVEEIRVGQTNFGFLGGGGVKAGDYVNVDAGGGFFQQGKFDLPDVKGQSVYTAGISARVVVHDKETSSPQSIDFLLYRNDPNKPQLIFKPETYKPGTISWSASFEGSNLWQNLKDFDEAGQTELQAARAFALQGNLKAGFLRASLTGIYRDLPFVLRNQPSFIPFQSLPEDAETNNEIFVAAAADYFIDFLHLTPGIGAGLQLPATFQTSSIDISSAPIERTVVVREQGNIAILPIGSSAVPIFQARASLKWDVSQILSAILWAQYVRDNNGTFVERDPNEGTVALRTFVKPDFFGLGSSVQARF